MTDFSKYRVAGAYHWRELSLHPTRGHPYTRSRMQWVVRTVRDIWPTRDVLDVGCGDGALTGLMLAHPVLKDRGMYCVGIDSDATARDLAVHENRAAGRGVVILDDIDWRAGPRFDAVVLAEVLEHVDNPGTLLERIRGVLRPGAPLILTTPIRKAETWDALHVHEWYPGELRALLSGYFGRVEIHPFQATWLVDLLGWTVLGRQPVRVACNLVQAVTGVNLVDRARSPSGLYWTQGAVCWA